MKKLQTSGFSIVEALIIVLVVGGLGFVGYRVVSTNKTKTEDKPASTTPTPSTAETKKAWTEGGIAVAGTYADADVLQIANNKWRMYYATQPEVQGNKLEVFSSTSDDGKTWTREPGTRKSMATFPDVVKLNNETRYRMYYQSAGVIKSSISTDGLTFTEESGTRIDTTNSANLTLDNVAAPSVMTSSDGKGYVMIYRGTINQRYANNTPNPTTQLLLWATSTDGLTFTKQGIAIDSRNETLNGQLDGPDLVTLAEEGKAAASRVFATSYTGVYEFSFDGKKFGEPVLAYAGEAKQTNQGFTGAPPGDPSVVDNNGIWYMYYGGPRDKNGINYATLK